jgi:Rrf2 family protein
MTLGLSEKQIAAIDAVLDIALHAGITTVHSGDITARRGIPRRYLEPILQQLSRSGVLIGTRGPQGGYRLARERRRITLGDLVRAMGAREVSAVVPIAGKTVGRRIVEGVLDDIEAMVMQRLDAVTIEELCWRARAEGGARPVVAEVDFAI